VVDIDAVNNLAWVLPSIIHVSTPVPGKNHDDFMDFEISAAPVSVTIRRRSNQNASADFRISGLLPCSLSYANQAITVQVIMAVQVMIVMQVMVPSWTLQNKNPLSQRLPLPVAVQVIMTVKIMKN